MNLSERRWVDESKKAIDLVVFPAVFPETKKGLSRKNIEVFRIMGVEY